jgi:hypothetical protein
MAELRVWRVNLGYLRSFFLPPFLIDFFYLFYHSTLYWLRIELYNLFWLVFYWVISVSWSKFIMLTRVDLDFFFYPFLINCFSISSFNIRLIENWLSKYFFFCFLWGYYGLVTWIVNLKKMQSLICFSQTMFFLVVQVIFRFIKSIGSH